MFHNVGKTIKGIAVATFAVLCASAFISGIVLMASDEELIGYGFLTWIVGPLVAFIDACFIYGFGEIVDTAIINRKEQPAPPKPTKPKKESLPQPSKAPAPKPEPPKPQKDMSRYIGKKRCSGCGHLWDKDAKECSCGSSYFVEITAQNAQRLLADEDYLNDLDEDYLNDLNHSESTPICKCGAIPEKVGSQYICPVCHRQFR